MMHALHPAVKMLVSIRKLKATHTQMGTLCSLQQQWQNPNRITAVITADAETNSYMWGCGLLLEDLLCVGGTITCVYPGVA